MSWKTTQKLFSYTIINSLNSTKNKTTTIQYMLSKLHNYYLTSHHTILMTKQIYTLSAQSIINQQVQAAKQHLYINKVHSTPIKET